MYTIETRYTWFSSFRNVSRANGRKRRGRRGHGSRCANVTRPTHPSTREGKIVFHVYFEIRDTFVFPRKPISLGLAYVTTPSSVADQASNAKRGGTGLSKTRREGKKKKSQPGCFIWAPK